MTGLGPCFHKPSRANEAAFDTAVDEVTAAARRLIESLTTSAPPRNREEAAARARENAKRLELVPDAISAGDFRELKAALARALNESADVLSEAADCEAAGGMARSPAWSSGGEVALFISPASVSIAMSSGSVATRRSRSARRAPSSKRST